MSVYSENSLLGLISLRESLRKHKSILYPSYIENLNIKSNVMAQLKMLRDKLINERLDHNVNFLIISSLTFSHFKIN